MNALHEAVAAAHAAGICIVPPREDGSKRPVGDEWTQYQAIAPPSDDINRWYGRSKGLGFVCGAISGNMECLEFDDREAYDAYITAAKSAGLDGLVDRIQAGYLEETPGGGIHWLYRCSEIAGSTKLARRPKRSDEMANPQDKIKVLIETRGEGGYVVVAPSGGKVHPSGRPYVLRHGGAAAIVTITPEERTALWDLARHFDQMPRQAAPEPKAAKSNGDTRPGDDFSAKTSWEEILVPAGWRLVYERNGESFWRRPGSKHEHSATTNYNGSDLLYVFSTSTEFETERGYSKFAAWTILNHNGDFQAAARELGSKGFGTPPEPLALSTEPAKPEPFHRTDLGNAKRFVARHGSDFRYCPKWRCWLVWTGQRWQRDEDGAVMRAAKETALSIYDEVKTSDDHKSMFKHAVQSESSGFLNAMIGLAQSEPGIGITHDALDTNPWLLNVRNGTIDLKTGILRPHLLEDLITKMAPVTYDPKSTAPTWDRFLDQIMLGREDLIAYLQRSAGYSLTGSTIEQVLFFLHGDGSNGKTTYIGALQSLLGDSAHQAKPDLLLAKKNDNEHPTSLASLFGMRVVVTAEVVEGRALAEGLMKGLTGDPIITARRMREDEWSFKPTHKIYLLANLKPKITGTDWGVWRRIMLVPFDFTLAEEDKDINLPAKLEAELSGILNWALKGCLNWQTSGLKPPEAVVAATNEYRTEMDVLATFFSDCCVLGPTRSVSAKDLYRAYTDWCEQTRERPETQRALSPRLTNRGFTRARAGGGVHMWNGIGLLTQRDDPKQSLIPLNNEKCDVSDVSYPISYSTPKETTSTQLTGNRVHHVTNVTAPVVEAPALPLIEAPPTPAPVHTNGHQSTTLKPIRLNILAASRGLDWQPFTVPGGGSVSGMADITAWVMAPERSAIHLNKALYVLTTQLQKGERTS